LKSLLEINPAKRITIQGILAHPWIADAKDSVELFTQAEKNFMISQIQKSAEEPQNFDADDIDQLLVASYHTTNKNNNTKSIILAPFNSTLSDLTQLEHYELPKEVRDLIQSKSCLNFATNVREIDRQYEVNNNAELDNGVYCDFNNNNAGEAKGNAPDREDSLKTDMRETKDQRRDAELQNLERMMNSEQDCKY